MQIVICGYNLRKLRQGLWSLIPVWCRTDFWVDWSVSCVLLVCLVSVLDSVAVIEFGRSSVKGSLKSVL